MQLIYSSVSDLMPAMLKGV